MKRVKYLLGCLFLGLLFFTGCSSNEEQVVEGTGIYYLNTEGTGLVKEKYRVKADDPQEQVEELLRELQKETGNIDYVSPYPQGVEIEKWELQGGLVSLYFNINYNDMSSPSEVLLRSATVQTLTQIKEVEYVSFYAAEQPVTYNNGIEIGKQSEEDFVRNIGSSLHSYQKGEFSLYFASQDGKKLESEKVSVRYNSNMSVEKMIVEEVLEGPMSSELQATFAADTKVLGVSVKDGICYVNFEEDFLTTTIAVDPNLTVYSLVNSIIDGGNVAKVQILVNGEANVKYMETIDLSQPFSRNLEIVREEE